MGFATLYPSYDQFRIITSSPGFSDGARLRSCERLAWSAPPLRCHSLLRLPEFFSYPFWLSAPDIDRLSLFEEGPDAFTKILGTAAQHLVAVFHRDHGLDRAGVDGHVEAFLRQSQAYRRRRQHRIDIRFGRGVKRGGIFHQFGDETDRERALGADEA